MSRTTETSIRSVKTADSALGEAVDDLGDVTRNAASEVGGAVRDAASTLGDVARRAADVVSENFDTENLKQTLLNFTREHPVAVTGIAFAAGIMVARALRRR